MNTSSELEIKLINDAVKKCILENLSYGSYPISLKVKINLVKRGWIKGFFNIDMRTKNSECMVSLEGLEVLNYLRDEDTYKICRHLWFIYRNKAYRQFYRGCRSTRAFLAKNLKWLREEKNLGLEESAKLLNITPDLLEKIENRRALKADIKKVDFKSIEDFYLVSREAMFQPRKFMSAVNFRFMEDASTKS